ncbi:MAG TPA: ubiquinone/menaquinone biosynthesis methyltransferase [bacterium]|jgi:demethylmenaquinone methyltransferase/2-methoxy-6-polyprenyl-1,4-benzoquinol methylase|nr:ubiquinone/menaquinone biosynthesis methyltransferase [bacterium]
MPDLKPEFSRYDSSIHPQAGEKEDYVEKLFDAVAPTYDLANRMMSFGLDKGWRRRLVRESGAAQGARVLDVGCGTGDLLMDFARRVTGLQGQGLDFSAGMLARAKAKDRWGLGWTEGSALSLPFDDSSFDAVASAWVLRSITDPGLFFREMQRVAKPGAKVLVLELTRPQKAWQRALYAPVLNIYVPVLGRLLSGHNDGYRYLSDTIKGFWPPEKVVELMGASGLVRARAVPLTLGAATLFIGEKPGMDVRA